MKSRHTIKFLIAGLFILTAFVFVERASAQAVAAYSIKNGRMYIQMSKDIKEAALDSFITDNELEDLWNDLEENEDFTADLEEAIADVDCDTTADFEIQLNGLHTLDASDFFL